MDTTTAAKNEDLDDETVGEFLVSIFEDVRTAERELWDADTPFRRRAFVRTTFASVEGFIFTIKKVALTKPDLFTTGELALLREEEHFLTDAGEVRSRPRFLSGRPTIVASPSAHS